MTVGELIAALSLCKEHEEVFFEHPSHDYWRTQLASEVVELSRKQIRYDPYHQQHSLPRRHDDDDAEDKVDGRQVVVIRSYR